LLTTENGTGKAVVEGRFAAGFGEVSEVPESRSLGWHRLKRGDMQK
jgi:hypothetical protein